VTFRGEDAIDSGGVTKELLSLSLKALVAESDVVLPCGNGHSLWFAQKFPKLDSLAEDSPLHILTEGLSASSESNTVNALALEVAYYLGLLVALAAYHGVLTDVPIVPSIYKIITGTSVSTH
jgi:hypothetical protein